MGETQGETLDVSQLASLESLPKSFLKYNQYLQPQNTQFSKEKKRTS